MNCFPRVLLRDVRLLLQLFLFCFFPSLSLADIPPAFRLPGVSSQHQSIPPLIAFSANSELRKRILNGIVEYGENQTNYLYDVLEPRLYHKGLVLDKRSPGYFGAAFNKQLPHAKELARYGYILLHASGRLRQQLSLSRQDLTNRLSGISLRETRLFQSCPVKSAASERDIICPPDSAVYRTADGVCNNPFNLEWGQSFRPFLRFMPPVYGDGIETIRAATSGSPLPNPRVISTLIHRSESSPSSHYSMMLMQWGQFIDHDLTAAAQTRGFKGSVPRCCDEQGMPLTGNDHHPDCMPILIPHNDSFYSSHAQYCMQFIRSSPVSRTDCPLGPREQINQITSYLDGSMIYGSTLQEQSDLRLYRDGMLRYTPLRHRKELLPPLREPYEDECRPSSANLHCFHAGDRRVNEQPGLASMHTIWMREHNQIANELSSLNPHWDDNHIFQETRKIVGALIQKITYGEFLRHVVGEKVIHLFGLRLLEGRTFYNGYNTSVNPTVANVFGAAAFRFGHSLVQGQLTRCDKRHRVVPIHGNFGMDLISINIQRGRDHGLPPYNEWRLSTREHGYAWKSLEESEYVLLWHPADADVNDIDLFTGAMAERPIVGGLVGPTFACLIAQQFKNLRSGDRFWFENGGFRSSFTERQLEAIRRVTLARVICDNLDDIETIQPNVFQMPEAPGNERTNCDNLEKLDLSPWKEFTRPTFYAPSLEDIFGPQGPEMTPTKPETLLNTKATQSQQRHGTPTDSSIYADDTADGEVPEPFEPIDFYDQLGHVRSEVSDFAEGTSTTTTSPLDSSDRLANKLYEEAYHNMLYYRQFLKK
ncbi:unnamed protein product [Cyprideis torosa]|uniref:Uncharacterized protein n=1 Tax=Cyprideis torosa TaxID=163714 RepID=A0A7R8WBF9_9CRUS|nr:unnamed protein product [Cyprideis torosa]CAG0892265.1 unnamed protein product [Cyprideis torosa]